MFQALQVLRIYLLGASNVIFEPLLNTGSSAPVQLSFIRCLADRETTSNKSKHVLPNN